MENVENSADNISQANKNVSTDGGTNTANSFALHETAHSGLNTHPSNGSGATKSQQNREEVLVVGKTHRRNIEKSTMQSNFIILRFYY